MRAELRVADVTEWHHADVVDIVRYSSTESSVGHLERHRSWLPLARTQSARYKIQKFVREQEKAVAAVSSAGAPFPTSCSSLLAPRFPATLHEDCVIR